ncbi:MAG: KH domain-containing protein [bacterium]
MEKTSVKDFLIYLSKSLVSCPDEVLVTERTLEDGTEEYTIKVSPGDMGRIIGRNGKTARALRLLVSAKASIENKRTLVEIAEEKQ